MGGQAYVNGKVVMEAEMLAHVVGALDGSLQGPLVARDHVGRSEAVDKARDGVKVLNTTNPHALCTDVSTEVLEVNGIAFINMKLSFKVEVGELLNLLDPPILLLKAKRSSLSSEDENMLCFKLYA